MTDESALAPVAEPEIVTEIEGETSDQVETPEGEQPEEQKSAAKERREREKAAKVRLREELSEARAAAAQSEARRQSILNAAKAEKEPKESEFPDPLEYVVAKAAWASEQKATNRQAAEVETEGKQAQQRADQLMAEEKAMLDQRWSEQAKEASGRYADFQKVVAAPGLFPVGTHLGPLIQMSEMAGDLAYAVASDRALHDDLLRMSPVEAAFSLGQIQADLRAPKPRTSTNAPAPVSPVRGAMAPTKSTKNMSYMEFKAFREAGGKL